jgi:ribosomal protein L34E
MIDMNNDTNKIVGIGLVKKVNIPENRTRVYDNEEFNRYIIKSPYYKDRPFLIKKDNKIIEFLENILFKGYSHLKRTSNMTLSFERLAHAPEIGSKFVQNKKEKRIYKCATCGLHKKGHWKTKQRQINNNKFDGEKWIEIIYNCPGERVEPIKDKYKKCKLCNKSLKGHAGSRPCMMKKRNIKNVKKVITYFESLFI